MSSMKKVSVDQMKEVIIFEEPEGKEDTIAMFYLYLDFLAKYTDGKYLTIFVEGKVIIGE